MKFPTLFKRKTSKLSLAPSDTAKQQDETMYRWAIAKCQNPRKAERFVVWYHKTLNYWLTELKKYPGNTFFDDPQRAAKLAEFDGQTFENLWKLFIAQY